MSQISVLMSVYNESENELRKSIESILNQTFTDFEFIIIIDNPKNKSIHDVVASYANIDDRIKVILNSENLGLAQSINKASEAAVGKFFLRMDADDISSLNRFELQYKIISENDYDIVCSDYHFIDEIGNLQDRHTEWYDSYSIIKLMPLRNVIHHPTIIMRADSFRKLGGYRNFPCAQDYDLWLRMVEENYKFLMMEDKLHYYRIRAEGITIKNRHKQQYTLRYIRDIYLNKKNSGEDLYSYDAYMKYIAEMGVGIKAIDHDFIHNYNKYISAIRAIKKGKFLSGTKKALQVIFFSKNYRPALLNTIQFAFLSKLLKLRYKMCILKEKYIK